MLVIPQYIMPSNVCAPLKEAWIGWDLSFKEQKISKWCFETFSSASLFGYLLVSSGLQALEHCVGIICRGRNGCNSVWSFNWGLMWSLSRPITISINTNLDLLIPRVPLCHHYHHHFKWKPFQVRGIILFDSEDYLLRKPFKWNLYEVVWLFTKIEVNCSTIRLLFF